MEVSLLASVITAPAAGASPFRTTVAVELLPPYREAGLTVTESSTAGFTVSVGFALHGVFRDQAAARRALIPWALSASGHEISLADILCGPITVGSTAARLQSIVCSSMRTVGKLHVTPTCFRGPSFLREEVV
jgi:hypothetical protein